MLRVAVAWFIWVALGVQAAKEWLYGACPAGGCSGILVLLDLPRFVLGAIAWLIVGVLGTIALAAVKPTKVEPPSSDDLRYIDGREIELGDEVLVPGERNLQGSVVQLRGVGLPEVANEPRLASAKTGLVMQSADGEFHYFPGTRTPMQLRSRRSGQNAP